MFTKTRSWLIVSLLAAASAFAQDVENNCRPNPCATKCRPTNSFEQGHELCQNQMMAAYNAPARIEVRGSWDVYATGSYIYWQAREENLDLGLISNALDPFGLVSTVLPAQSLSSVVHPHFTFRSGFKVGLGLNLDYDNWDVYSEYTWFHSNIATGIEPFPTFSPLGGSPSGHVIYPSQGHPDSSLPITYYLSANQSWKLKMDFLDLSLARSYYSGTKLTMRPFFGVRAAWIRQKMFNEYNGSTLETVATAHFKDTVLNKTVSQGLGPRAGFESNWLLGYGFRLTGDASADILYTRYNFLFQQKRVDLSGAGSIFTNAKLKEEHLDYLRAHADFEMGFGWGSYFDCNNWHIDLSASYGLQVFWDQNMFRNFVDGFMEGKNISPNGNLYIHGVTATLKLDF